MKSVTVVNHPLVQHKLTLMRKTETSTTNFRTLAQELSLLLGYEVLRDLPLTQVPIETPLQPMNAPTLEGKKVVFISVLRAGAGILDGFLRLVPAARVGYIGLFRDPKTLQPVEYYFKIPSEMEDREAIVVDPMLATGNSAVAAVARVKETNPRKIKFVCLLAAPEGIAVMQEAHPDVPIFTACIDERLNDKGYILPGLGDAGDRLFGTK
ncbi:MAG: uracil phosphoribosyltransferase [Myxococcales bacterium]|nr:uracil phosphoribosyltransferase [Myxococcales bacterium]